MGFRELVAYEGEDKEEKLPKMTSTQAPFPLTPEFYDANLMDSDATWPTDPAVPELPPLPATDDPEPPVNNFLNVRFWDGLHTPKEGPTPRQRTRPITSEDLLKVDVIYSHRSPYSYLITQRLVWLHSNYNVDVTVRLVLPEAMRSTKGGAQARPGAPSPVGTSSQTHSGTVSCWGGFKGSRSNIRLQTRFGRTCGR
jgi:hypothetical protein